jgi:hypothetical protein
MAYWTVKPEGGSRTPASGAERWTTHQWQKTCAKRSRRAEDKRAAEEGLVEAVTPSSQQ